MGKLTRVLLGQPHDSTPARIYVKDPSNVFNDNAVAEAFDDDAELPSIANDSGFRQKDAELWTVPDDHTMIYLAFEDHVEAWPLDESPPGCG